MLTWNKGNNKPALVRRSEIKLDFNHFDGQINQTHATRFKEGGYWIRYHITSSL
jgi:hypothetical protein